MEFYAGSPVIGFRSWTIDAEKPILRSSVIDNLWMRGIPTRATCVPCNFRRMHPYCPKDHQSPHELCSCGLYGWYESTPLNIEDFQSLSPIHINEHRRVFGTIVAWGHVIFHDSGFKAEYAIPLAIIDHYSLRDKVYKDRLREISFEYEIPILKKNKLASYSQRYGIEAKEYL